MLIPLSRNNSLIAYVSGTKTLCRKRPLYRQLKPRRGEPETPSKTLNTADWRYFFLPVGWRPSISPYTSLAERAGVTDGSPQGRDIALRQLGLRQPGPTGTPSAVKKLPTITDGCLNAITDIPYFFDPQRRSQIINVGAH